MFTYMSHIATFAFVPMNERVARKFGRGMGNVYKKQGERLNEKLGGQTPSVLDKRYEQYIKNERAQQYARKIENPNNSFDWTDDYENDDWYRSGMRVITGNNSKGKQVSKGIRLEHGRKNPRGGYDIAGETLIHPKYKITGTNDLIDALANEANIKKRNNYYVSGATHKLENYYHKMAQDKQIPRNLYIN